MADVYRSAAGRSAVQQWCEAQLDGWPTPTQRAVVGTRLGPTHLLTAGSGEVTVVYLPGTNANASTSASVVTALARRHSVVVADVPGQPGLSAANRPGGRRLAAYGAWAGEVIASLRRDRVVLVGHSLGAAIALSTDPSGVAGLVLLDPAGIIRLRVNPAVLAATSAWLLRPAPARSARLVQHLHAGSWEPSAREVEWMTLVARHTRTSLAPFPVAAAVVRPWCTVPRRLLSGQHDTFLPVRRLRAAARQKLDVELEVLDGAGHLTTEERPESVVAAVDGVAGPARA
jgi:pimeloyl-ACP methyl ester carboxylesterase